MFVSYRARVLILSVAFFGQVRDQAHYRIDGGQERWIVERPRDPGLRRTRSESGVLTMPGQRRRATGAHFC